MDKVFYALSYLPHEEVSDGFSDLMSIAPNMNFTFSDYILENYIASDINFSQILWVCEPINSPRNTNDTESFNKHFNSELYTAHSHILQVIDIIIIEIQGEIDLKINSINITKPIFKENKL